MATVTVKNTGATKVIAFTGTFVVSAVNYSTAKSVEPTEREITEPLRSPGIDPYNSRFSRHYPEAEFTVVTAGKRFAENRYLESGEELTREYAVAGPAVQI
jgi:hypothetical protein